MLLFWIWIGPNKDLKVNTQGVFFVPPKDIYFLLNIIMIILDNTCIVNYEFVFLAFFFCEGL